MTEHIIPPMTDVGPVTKIEQGENGYKVTIGYTAQAIDEIVRRVNEKLDEEMMARLAEQHGYVKVVRCRDCKHFTPKGTHKFKNGKTNNDYCTYIRGWMLQITPDGFCAWAERKEGGDGLDAS